MTEQTKAQRAWRRWAEGQSESSNLEDLNGARGSPGDPTYQKVDKSTERKIPPAFWRPQGTDTMSEPFSLRRETSIRIELSSLATVALMGLGLLALELANAGTTYWALDNLMGDVGTMGAPFAAVLTLGLAALDAGGLLRIFSDSSTDRGFTLWALMGAWLVASTSNLIATWYTVGAAMSDVTGNNLLTAVQLVEWAPIVIALALYLIRVLAVAAMAHDANAAMGR